MSVLVVILTFICLLLFCAVALMGYYLYKFTRIILTFEDDIADVQSSSSLVAVEDAMKKLDEVKMFYEDDTIKNHVTEILEHVKIARHYVNWMAKRFTDRSKNRYETIEPTEEEIQEFLKTMPKEQQQEREGTVAYVGR